MDLASVIEDGHAAACAVIGIAEHGPLCGAERNRLRLIICVRINQLPTIRGNDSRHAAQRVILKAEDAPVCSVDGNTDLHRIATSVIDKRLVAPSIVPLMNQIVVFIIIEPGNQAIRQPLLHQQAFLIVKAVQLMPTTVTNIDFVLTFIIGKRLIGTVVILNLRGQLVLIVMIDGTVPGEGIEECIAAAAVIVEQNILLSAGQLLPGDPALIVVFIVQIVMPILVGNVRNVSLGRVAVMDHPAVRILNLCQKVSIIAVANGTADYILDAGQFPCRIGKIQDLPAGKLHAG